MGSTSQKRVCMVYVPVSKRRIAKKIASLVITEKLAACANIIGPSVSLFRWRDKKVASVREYILILKTTNAKFPQLQKKIVRLHPYDCPCIAKIDISSLNEAYRTWLVTSVA